MSLSPQILTLTGNLLAEHTLDYSNWAPGQTQRATGSTFQVGGKGINVSRMLRRLGTTATALCFTGGTSGDECRRWLTDTQLPHHAFPCTSPTRTGFVVRSPLQPETTFLGPDNAPDSAALLACADYLLARHHTHVLALCGSFPGWSSPSAAPLLTAIKTYADAGRLYVDTYGPPLISLIHTPAALVKINRQEFDALFPLADHTLPVATRLHTARTRWPVRAWIVTDGPRDLWYISPETPTAQAITPPSITEVSATGSGDVFFASLLHALLEQRTTLAAAIHFALPHAAANAASDGIAEFDLNPPPQSRSFTP